MPRVLVADAVGDVCLEILKKAGIEVEKKVGLNEADLCAQAPNYDGIIVRSAARITAAVIAAGKKLRILGRAGVGVDNIDVEAATKAGIVVENTPGGNTTSAAEHAVALMFSLARNIPSADRQMRAAGAWPKSGMTGVELNGKVLGILGLGRVGVVVAKIARAAGMTVMVYDPYLPARRAAELGVECVELEAILPVADFLTVHSPLTPATRHLLNAERIGKMKKGARLINAARGGIVDEVALAEALKSGRLAGAACDVFETEPLGADSPLRSLPNIVLTPHLGASTVEAQERVSVEIAEQFVEFFRDGTVRNAVNLTVNLAPRLQPFARLAESMGSMLAQLADPTKTTRLRVGCHGRLATEDARTMSLFALKGFLSRTGAAVTLVNAAGIAESSGITFTEERSDESGSFVSLLSLAAVSPAGTRSIAGTCFDDVEPRIVEIDGFHLDLRPSERVLFFVFADRPGVIGRVGTMLGEAGVNIATMAFGRRQNSTQAVLTLAHDNPLPPGLGDKIRAEINATELRSIELPPAGGV